MSTTQTSQLRFNELLNAALHRSHLQGELKAVFSPLKMTLEENKENSEAYAQALEALETAEANAAAVTMSSPVGGVRKASV